MSTALDTIIVDALKSYLRVCKSGGMKQKHIDRVLATVKDAGELAYFTAALAGANVIRQDAIHDTDKRQRDYKVAETAHISTPHKGLLRDLNIVLQSALEAGRLEPFTAINFGQPVQNTGPVTGFNSFVEFLVPKQKKRVPGDPLNYKGLDRPKPVGNLPPLVGTRTLTRYSDDAVTTIERKTDDTFGKVIDLHMLREGGWNIDSGDIKLSRVELTLLQSIAGTLDFDMRRSYANDAFALAYLVAIGFVTLPIPIMNLGRVDKSLITASKLTIKGAAHLSNVMQTGPAMVLGSPDQRLRGRRPRDERDPDDREPAVTLVTPEDRSLADKFTMPHETGWEDQVPEGVVAIYDTDEFLYESDIQYIEFCDGQRQFFGIVIKDDRITQLESWGLIARGLEDDQPTTFATNLGQTLVMLVRR